MRRGESFELESLNYLKEYYSYNDSIQYVHHKTTDSTHSDIEVLINGESKFFIEAKDTNAQSGQFVLIPNDESQTFLFSPRNKSNPNSITDIIITHMNGQYDIFKNAGKSGCEINLDSKNFINWIISYYKQKNVRYIITKMENMIILPIDRFGEYFNVSAKYRSKKSGSNPPAIRDIPDIINILESNLKIKTDSIYKVIEEGKNKLYVASKRDLSGTKFDYGKYTYYLSKHEAPFDYEVRRLSNTNNMNVIFSIIAKKEQLNSDLEIFKAELR